MNSKEVSMSYTKKRKQTTVYDFWTSPDGKRLLQAQETADRTSLPPGCGAAKLSHVHHRAMQDLCDTIINDLPDMVPWGDGWVDRKQRGYGMVPEHSKWKNSTSIVDNGIVMHDVDASSSKEKRIMQAAVKKHKHTIDKSFTDVTLSPVQLSALQEIIAHVKHILHAPHNAPHLQPYELQAIDISELVAIQPNIHNGDDYLPLHLDNPRHDGFGVVIVTLALWGSGDIVLVDDGDPQCETGTQDVNTTAADATTCAGRSPNGTSCVFEGGIVYENGKFTCSEGGSETSQLHAPDAPTEQLQAGRDAVMANPASTTNKSCDTEETAKSVPVASESKSWAFHLHPGELYVLSGHSRNKCAHGVVVMNSTAPDNATQADNTTITAASTNYATAVSTTVACDVKAGCLFTSDSHSGNGLMDLASAAASAVLTSMSDPATTTYMDKTGHLLAFAKTAMIDHVVFTSTENNDGTGSAEVGACSVLDPAVCVDSDASVVSDHSSSCRGATSGNCRSVRSIQAAMHTRNKIARANTAARTSADYKAGRVSLNFRFGLHTQEQAWGEIDRHWGK